MPPAEELYAENLSLKEENTVLRAEIGWLKQKLFGGGQSDRLDRTQLLLKLSELENSRPRCRRANDHVRADEADRGKRGTGGNLRAPAGERDDRDRTGGGAGGAGRLRRAHVRSRRRPTATVQARDRASEVSEKADKTEAPVVAPAPGAVPGGYASAGLLAWIAITKYVDHLPLFRLEQMSRGGVRSCQSKHGRMDPPDRRLVRADL